MFCFVAKVVTSYCSTRLLFGFCPCLAEVSTMVVVRLHVVAFDVALNLRHNLVRGHQTGSNNSGVEEYIRD